MEISNNIKKVAAKYPRIAFAGYKALQVYWKYKADFIDYGYPQDSGIASISLDDVKKYNKVRQFGPRKRICYAPFSNMHFQMNGDVSACSFNYDFTLGNIHNQSVKDIWFGDKANSFRSTLANYNMNKCLSCKHVFESGNYTSFPPLKYDIHGSDEVPYPTQMSFEISNLCNYECIMCNEDFSSLIRKNRMNLPPQKYMYPDNFLEQLEEFLPHLRIATFIGGEPLLIKQYFAIWEKILAVNKKCTIHIQTNGSYLPPAFLRMLESSQFEIGVSLDAPDKSTFESIRLNSNFDEVQSNIKTLLEYKKRGKIFMNFNFCPLVANWKVLPAMVDYANNADVALKIVNVETPRHLALQYRSERFLRDVHTYLLNAHIHTKKNLSIQTQRNVETFKNYLLTIESYIKRSQDSYCDMDVILVNNRTGLFELLYGLMKTNLLFNAFSVADKEYMYNEAVSYILTKSEAKSLTDDTINRVIAQIILSYREAEHQVDSTVSNDVKLGMMMYKRLIDEYILLEEALYREADYLVG